ncbi:hypothetical protein KEM54_002435 [Ascosphaera aggregata]|nr:hypothetical protein KEM54_002435 [Ascosphaera aggregata]
MSCKASICLFRSGRLSPASSIVTRASRSLRFALWKRSVSQAPGSDHVHFPGAVNSRFRSQMEFVRPSEQPAIDTYRVMDSDGVIVDKSWSLDADNDEVLKWYKDMLTGSSQPASPICFIACFIRVNGVFK